MYISNWSVSLDTDSNIWGVIGVYCFMGHYGNFDFGTIISRQPVYRVAQIKRGQCSFFRRSKHVLDNFDSFW